MMHDKVEGMVNEHWSELVAAIPVDLEATARAEGALRRRRGVPSAVALLRLILMYALLLSLRQTALWAACLGLCDISRQALQRRIANSTTWLRTLVQAWLREALPVPPVVAEVGRRLVLLDACSLARRGSSGTEWRVHLAYTLFGAQPADVQLTDAHRAELAEHVALQADDIVIADRAYGIWRSLQAVLQAGADAIVRITYTNFPLQHADGTRFAVIDWLRALPATQAHHEVTLQAVDDPQQRPLRLVAARLPPEQAARAPAHSAASA